MAQEDIEQKIKLTYETNADEASQTVNNLTNNVDKTTDAQTKSAKATKLQGDAIRDLAPAATSAVDSLKSMGKAMWALVANPLGIVLTAIAVVIGVLFLAFKSFQPLIDKVEQSFAALGAVVNVIKTTFIAVVTGTKSLGEAFGGLSDDMSIAAKRTMALVKAQQDLEDAMEVSEVSTARTNAQINKLNAQLKNINLTEEERLKIAEKSEKLQKEVFNSKVKEADQLVKNAREAISTKANLTKEEEKQLKKQGVAYKDYVELKGADVQEEFKTLKEAQLKRIALEDEATVRLEKNFTKQETLQQAKKDKADKAASDATSRREKAEAESEKRQEKASADKTKREEESQKVAEAKRKKEIDDAYNLKLEQDQVVLDTQTASDKRVEDQAAKDAEAGANKLARIKGEYEEEMAIKEAMLQQEQAIQDAKVNIAQQAIQLISNIFGKSKAVQKAAIIAENAIGIGKMIIANNTANVAALATPQAIASSGASAVPVIALNNISTGIGVASSIAATAKALKSVGGGTAGGGSQTSGPRGSSGASATPQVNFQASSENQIGNTVAGRLNAQPPIRVTVLESDITKTQTSVQAKVVSNSF